MTLMEPTAGIMVAVVSQPGLDDFRIRIPQPLKEAWDAMAERKRIKQQDAGAALIEWFLSLPDLMQSSILGQIDDESQILVARLVLERMAAPPAPKPTAPFDAVAASIRSAPEHAPAPRKRRGDRRG
jgi:hypothetical protein